MEVGAVKQAFNNEVILLKKKLNQAKIQIIHKLTRKAKQLTEKKVPEKLTDKLKRKAESAVKEVLIIKKIKARDIAKFIVTHKEDLKTYLNKPQVDNDKACARLLLHKSMHEKYNFIRNRFNNVSIKDLFMSRQERLKLKKEAKEKQKNKKKEKTNKVVSEKGNWDVEDISQGGNNTVIMNVDDEEHSNIGNNDVISDDNMVSDNESNKLNVEIIQSKDTDNVDLMEENEIEIGDQSDEEGNENEDSDEDEAGDSINSDVSKIPETVAKFVKLKSVTESKESPGRKSIKKSPINRKVIASKATEKSININKNDTSIESIKPNIEVDITINRKVKDINKNRNLNEKIQQKKFKKATEDNMVTEKKVVDPFFITSTGEHYMSLAEPRQPDEVKEVHKEGNRKLRRAVMFGHELKVKPRNNVDNNNDFRKSHGKFRNDRIAYNDKKSDFNNRMFSSQKGANDRTDGFGGRKGDFNNKGRKINDNETRFSNKDYEKPKEEKLHPSWEAKKRQSGILPFQGKKIVFDES